MLNFNPTTLTVYRSTPSCNGSYLYDVATYIQGGAATLQKDFLICQGGAGGSCQAGFVHQVTGTNTVQFTNSSVGSNPNATLTYSWNFGGGTGNTSTQNPVVTYPSTGIYYVNLSIVDNTGCTSSATDSVWVGSCQANFTTQVASNTIYCQNLSQTANGTIGTPLWTVNNQTFQNINLVWTAPAAGTYNICLTVTDSIAQCSDTYCQTVTTTGTNLYDLQGYVQIDSLFLFGNSDTVMVYLIQHDTVAGTLTAIDSMQVYIGTGYYMFPSLPAGDYLVKAAMYVPSSAAYPHYLPTYYADFNYYSLFWSGASTISLPHPTLPPSTEFDIHLIPGANPGGPGFIGGLISQGANKMSGVALPNRQVMLLNMNDSPVAYTYSDANGEYSFSNLAYGTYKVYTEVLGKSTDPIIVTIDAASPSATGLEVVINSTGVTTAIYENFDRIQTMKNVYPNPISGKAHLDITMKQNTAISVEVLNLLGQIVYQKSDNYAAGSHQIELNVQNLEKGIYMMRIFVDGNLEKVEKIIKQ